MSGPVTAGGAPDHASLPVTGPTLVTSRHRPFAHIVSVEGGQALAAFDTRGSLSGLSDDERIEIGSIVTITTPSSHIIGVVTGLSVPMGSYEVGEDATRLMELDLVGEIVGNIADRSFKRGVSLLPALGDAVARASHQDLELIYSARRKPAVTIGSLYQDADIPAAVMIDDLLGKHFAVVGSTGAGKSCGVAAILHAIIGQYPESRIVVLDVHNEYSAAFRGQAEMISPANLQLPFWLLSFDELASVFTTFDEHQAEDIEILHDAVLYAKKRYVDATTGRQSQILKRSTEGTSTSTISVDAPSPFRLQDVAGYIDEQLGQLERTQSLVSLRRMKIRIDTLTTDVRYAFMFGSITIQDKMAEILSRIFRIPSAGKPVTIIDLSAVPSEILNVVISVICRMAFDLGVWSKGQLPITLICEEAHRYAPTDQAAGFEPTRRSLARIAKEGRKYGISLGVITQRPAELDATLLSQCSTIFAHRLSNESDQRVVRSRSADCAVSLLDFLSSLGDGEAIAVGQGVAMPMRIRFTRLPLDKQPASQSAQFSKFWVSQGMGLDDVEKVVARWRYNRRDED
ncbi:MAG: DUF87 domain-containing protein [Alphaproteobacteria bacterium]|nr:DUF87 domain-containing protein [Alphaproteobacteria bacterium]